MSSGCGGVSCVFPGEAAVEEPVRLACPRCDLVYRLKKYQPDREYACKRCGTALLPPDDAAVARQNVASEPTGQPGRKRSVRTGAASGGVSTGPGGSSGSGGSGGSDLSRLPKLVEELTVRLEALDKLSMPGFEDTAAKLDSLGETQRLLEERLARLDERVEGVLEANLRDFAVSLEERLSHLDGTLEADVTAGASVAEETRIVLQALAERVADLDNRLTQSVGGDLYEKLGELKERIAGVAETFVDRAVTPDAIQAVRLELKSTHTDLLQRLDEYRLAQQSELRTLLTPADGE